MVARLRLVEDVDPAAQLFERLVVRGRGDDDLQPLHGRKLNLLRARLVAVQRNRKTEHRQHVSRLFRQARSINVPARNHHLRPPLPQRTVELRDDLPDLAQILFRIDHQQQIALLKFHRLQAGRQELPDLRSGLLGPDVLQPEQRNFSIGTHAVPRRCLRDRLHRAEMDHVVLPCQVDVRRLHHLPEQFPELPARQLVLQRERHRAVQFAVEQVVEFQQFREDRDDIRYRRAVEVEFRLDFLPAVETLLRRRDRRFLRFFTLRVNGIGILRLFPVRQGGRLLRQQFVFDRTLFRNRLAVRVSEPLFPPFFSFPLLPLLSGRIFRGSRASPEQRTDQRVAQQQANCIPESAQGFFSFLCKSNTVFSLPRARTA